ncbi:Set domain-containing protein 5 [Mycena indigotica]|uniref:Set domain-containing protein 5 n=1 Tax=Mycena indigotica TaxID=2126181 RepID=A0A8H6T7Q7_9AGAR|nr:Set domain-containing protein 5 [Mycena indigotica]KAF7311887.1 Set domain-containing protein 5 [Mycena indigotica]
MGSKTKATPKRSGGAGLSWRSIALVALIGATLATLAMRPALRSFVVGHVSVLVSGSQGSADALDPDMYDYEGHMADRKIFEVVALPGKGKGAIAVRDIKRGELVLREKPLLVAPDEETPRAWVNELFFNWTYSPSKRDTFFNLTHSHLWLDDDPETGLPPKVNIDPPTQTPDERFWLTEAILTTNVAAITLNDAPLRGLFPRFSRVNHVCPGANNVNYEWREEEGEMRIYAVRDIKKGTELGHSYIGQVGPRAARIKHLEETYGFTCNCKFCTLDAEATEQRDAWAAEWKALETDFDARSGNGTLPGKEAIRIVRDLWELSLKLDYTTDRARFSEEAGLVAIAHGDKKAAVQWLKLAHKYFTIEVGVDSVDAERVEELLDNPTKADDWASKERLTLDGPDKAWFDT